MNLTLIGFYTRSGSYPEEAALLRESARRVGLETHIVSVPNSGSWDLNTARKPGFIRASRRFFRGPLLYVDVDAFVHEDPRPLLEPFAGVDFALHYFRGPSKGHDRSKVRAEGWWPLTGTIFVGDTPGAYEILEHWIRRNVEKATAGVTEGGGQANLQEILPWLSERYAIGRLPGELCFVYDKPWAYDEGTRPVIEHTIASREHRDPPRSTKHLVESRRRRIEELRELVAP